IGGDEERAQPAEAVRVDEPKGNELAERLLELGPQQAAALSELVEEGGALLANEVEDALRAAARRRLLRRCRERRPEPGIPPREQHDRRRAHRRDAAFAPGGGGAARAQPRPGDAPGKAVIVEPGRLVAGKTRRQDLGLPGAGRRLVAFELADDGEQRVRALHARIGRNALPAQEEAQEVARRDR